MTVFIPLTDGPMDRWTEGAHTDPSKDWNPDLDTKPIVRDYTLHTHTIRLGELGEFKPPGEVGRILTW